MSDAKSFSESNNQNEQGSLSEKYLDSLIKFSNGSLNSILSSSIIKKIRNCLIYFSNISTSGNFR